MEQLILKEHGFIVKTWSSEQKTYLENMVDLSTLDLIDQWNNGITIDPDVTFGSFVSLLRIMSPGLIDTLERLTNSSIWPYLNTATEFMGELKEGTYPLTAIEIYKVLEISNYNKEDKHPDFSINEWAHGLSDVPYIDPHDGSKYEQRSWAIEFLPWHKLLHLPLKLASAAIITEHVYTDCEEKPIFINCPELGTSDRELVSSSDRTVIVYFTLGEFLWGLFSEVAWFSSPLTRNEEEDDLNQLLKEAVKSYEKDIDGNK